MNKSFENLEKQPTLPTDLNEDEKKAYKELRMAMNEYGEITYKEEEKQKANPNHDKEKGEIAGKREQILTKIENQFGNTKKFGSTKIPFSRGLGYSSFVMQRIMDEAPEYSKEYPGVLKESLSYKLSTMCRKQGDYIKDYRREHNEYEKSQEEILSVLRKENERNLNFFIKSGRQDREAVETINKLQKEKEILDQTIETTEKPYKSLLAKEDIDYITKDTRKYLTEPFKPYSQQ